MPDLKRHSTGELGNTFAEHPNTDHVNTHGLDNRGAPGVEGYISEDIINAYSDNRPVFNLLSNDEMINESIDSSAGSLGISALLRNNISDWQLSIGENLPYTDPENWLEQVNVTPLKINKGVSYSPSKGVISSLSKQLVGFKRDDGSSIWVDVHQWSYSTTPVFDDPSSSYTGYYRAIYTDIAESKLPDNHEDYVLTLRQINTTGNVYSFDIYSTKDVVIPLSSSIFDISNEPTDFSAEDVEYPKYNHYPNSYVQLTSNNLGVLEIGEDAIISKNLRREEHKLYAYEFNAEAGVFKAELKSDVFRQNKSTHINRIENDTNFIRVLTGVKSGNEMSRLYFNDQKNALGALEPMYDNRDFLGNQELSFEIAMTGQFSDEYKKIYISSPETRGHQEFGLSVADPNAAMAIANGTYDFNIKLNNDIASINIAIPLTTASTLNDVADFINVQFAATNVYAWARVFDDSNWELRIYSKSSGDYSKVALTAGTTDLAAALGGAYEAAVNGISEWDIYQDPLSLGEHLAVRSSGITTTQDFNAGTIGRQLFEALVAEGYDDFTVGIDNRTDDVHTCALFVATNNSVQGYQELNMNVPIHSSLSGLTPLYTYYFKLSIDDASYEEFNFTTTTDVTYSGILDAINNIISGKASVSFSIANDIKFTSDTYGPQSSIQTADGTTGTNLFGAAYPAAGFTPVANHDTPVNGTGETISIKARGINTFTIFEDLNEERAVYSLSDGKLYVTPDAETDIRDYIDTEHAYITQTAAERWSTHNDRVIIHDISSHTNWTPGATVTDVFTAVLNAEVYLLIGNSSGQVFFTKNNIEVYDEDLLIDNIYTLFTDPDFNTETINNFFIYNDSVNSKDYLFVLSEKRIYYADATSGLVAAQNFDVKVTSTITNVTDEVFTNIYDAVDWVANVDPGTSTNKYIIFTGASDSSSSWLYAPIVYALYDSSTLTFSWYAEEIYLKTQIDDVKSIVKFTGWADTEQTNQLFITNNANGPEIWSGNSQNNDTDIGGGGDDRFNRFSWAEANYENSNNYLEIDDELANINFLENFDGKIYNGGNRVSASVYGGVYSYSFNKEQKYFKKDSKETYLDSANNYLYVSISDGFTANSDPCIAKISEEQDDGRAQLVSTKDLSTVSNWPADSAFRVSLVGFNIGGIDYDGEYNISFNGQGTSNLQEIVNVINAENSISEISQITINSSTLADYNGTYFKIFVSTTEYDVWFDITGVDAAPAGATQNPTKCDISACAGNINAIATAIAVTINGISGITSSSITSPVIAAHDAGINIDINDGTAGVPITTSVTQQGSDATSEGFKSAYEVSNPTVPVDLTPIIRARALTSITKFGNVYTNRYKMAIESKVADAGEGSGHTNTQETTQSNCSITINHPTVSGSTIVGSGNDKIEIISGTIAEANLQLVDYTTAECYQLKRISTSGISFGGATYINITSQVSSGYEILAGSLRVKSNSSDELGFSQARGQILKTNTATGLANDATIYTFKVAFDYGNAPAGVVEVSDITCPADVAGSLSGKYWTLNAPDGKGGDREYYVWYDVDNLSTDPAPASKIGIEVDISANDAANDVASKTDDAIANFSLWFNSSVLGPVVTVTNVDVGSVTDAANVDAGVGVNVTQQGVNPGHTVDHVSIVGSAAQTIQNLINEINADLTAGTASLQTIGATAEYCDIVITSTLVGNNSAVKIELDNWTSDIYLFSKEALDIIPNTSIQGSTPLTTSGSQTIGYSWENADYFLVPVHPDTSDIRIYIPNGTTRINTGSTVWLDFWQWKKLTKIDAKTGSPPANNIPVAGEWTFDLEQKKIVVGEQPTSGTPDDIIFVDAKVKRVLRKMDLGDSIPATQTELSDEYHGLEPRDLENSEISVARSLARLNALHYGVALWSTDVDDPVVMNYSFFLPRLDLISVTKELNEYGNRAKFIKGIPHPTMPYVELPLYSQNDENILYSTYINSQDYNTNNISELPWYLSDNITRDKIYLDGTTQHFKSENELISTRGLTPLRDREKITKELLPADYKLVKTTDPIGVYSYKKRNSDYQNIDFSYCIFLDPINGNDFNTGYKKTIPVKTLQKAIDNTTATRQYIIIIKSVNTAVDPLLSIVINKSFKVYIIAEYIANIPDLTISSELYIEGINVTTQVQLLNGHNLSCKYCQLYKIITDGASIYTNGVNVAAYNTIIEKEGLRVEDSGGNTHDITGNINVLFDHVFIQDDSQMLYFDPNSYNTTGINEFVYNNITNAESATGNVIETPHETGISITINNSMFPADTITKFASQASIVINKSLTYTITNSLGGSIVSNDSQLVSSGDIGINANTGAPESIIRGGSKDSYALKYADRFYDVGAYLENRISNNTEMGIHEKSFLKVANQRIPYRYNLSADRISIYIRFKPTGVYNSPGVLFDSRYDENYNPTNSLFNFVGSDFIQIVYDNKIYETNYLTNDKYCFKVITSNGSLTNVCVIGPYFTSSDYEEYNLWHEIAVSILNRDIYNPKYEFVNLGDDENRQQDLIFTVFDRDVSKVYAPKSHQYHDVAGNDISTSKWHIGDILSEYFNFGGGWTASWQNTAAGLQWSTWSESFYGMIVDDFLVSSDVIPINVLKELGNKQIIDVEENNYTTGRFDDKNTSLIVHCDNSHPFSENGIEPFEDYVVAFRPYEGFEKNAVAIEHSSANLIAKGKIESGHWFDRGKQYEWTSNATILLDTEVGDVNNEIAILNNRSGNLVVDFVNYLTRNISTTATILTSDTAAVAKIKLIGNYYVVAYVKTSNSRCYYKTVQVGTHTVGVERTVNASNTNYISICIAYSNSNVVIAFSDTNRGYIQTQTISSGVIINGPVEFSAGSTITHNAITETYNSDGDESLMIYYRESPSNDLKFVMYSANLASLYVANSTLVAGQEPIDFKAITFNSRNTLIKWKDYNAGANSAVKFAVLSVEGKTLVPDTNIYSAGSTETLSDDVSLLKDSYLLFAVKDRTTNYIKFKLYEQGGNEVDTSSYLRDYDEEQSGRVFINYPNNVSDIALVVDINDGANDTGRIITLNYSVPARWYKDSTGVYDAFIAEVFDTKTFFGYSLHSLIDHTTSAGETGIFVAAAESGDLTEWSFNTQTDGTIAADASALAHGSYGYLFQYNGAGSVLHLDETGLAGVADTYSRFYITIDSLFQLTGANPRKLEIAKFGPATDPVVLDIEFNDPVGGGDGKYILNATTTAYGTNTTITSIFNYDTWHYIDIRWVNNVANGGWEVWVDGVPTFSHLTQNTSTEGNATIFTIGSTAGTTPPSAGSKLYFDDARIDSTYIGPYIAGLGQGEIWASSTISNSSNKHYISGYYLTMSGNWTLKLDGAALNNDIEITFDKLGDYAHTSYGIDAVTDIKTYPINWNGVYKFEISFNPDSNAELKTHIMTLNSDEDSRIDELLIDNIKLEENTFVTSIDSNSDGYIAYPVGLKKKGNVFIRLTPKFKYDTTVNHTIFCGTNITESGGDYITHELYYDATDDKFKFYLTDGDGVTNSEVQSDTYGLALASTEVTDLNERHTIAINWDVDNEIIEMFIDNRLYTATFTTLPTFRSSIMTFIGNRENKTTSADCLFDLIRVGDESLTQKEIANFSNKNDPFVHPNSSNIGDVVVSSLSFYGVHASDQATIFSESDGETSSLVIAIGDEHDDKVIIRHFGEDLATFGSGGLNIKGWLNIETLYITATATLTSYGDHITLRYGFTGTPPDTNDIYLESERGSSINSELRYDESQDAWVIHDGNNNSFSIDGTHIGTWKSNEDFNLVANGTGSIKFSLNTSTDSGGGDGTQNRTDGTEYMHIIAAETVINETGLDHDFRVESDNSEHMLFVDASKDKVTINETKYTGALGDLVVNKGITITEDSEALIEFRDLNGERIGYLNTDKLRNTLITRGDCESQLPPTIVGDDKVLTVNATFTRKADHKYSGSWSYKFNVNASSSAAAVYFHSSTANNDMHKMVPGYTYELSMRVYIPSGNILNNEISIGLEDYDSITTTWNSTTVNPAATYDAWQYVKVERQIATSASYTAEAARVFIRAAASVSGNDNFFIDDVKLEISEGQLVLTDLLERGDCEFNDDPTLRGDSVTALCGYATWKKDGTQPLEGAYSRKFTKTGGVGTVGFAYITDNYNTGRLHGIVSDKTYIFTVWIYVPSSGMLNSNEISIVIRDYLSSWDYSNRVGPSNIYDRWFKLQVSKTIRSWAGGANAYIRVSSNVGSSRHFYVDKMSFEEVNRTAEKVELIDRGDCESTTSPMIFGETIPVLGSATWARSATQQYAGSYSYRFTKTIASGTEARVDLDNPSNGSNLHKIIKNKRYTFSMQIYIPSASGIQGFEINIIIFYWDGTQWVYRGVPAKNVYDEWQYLRVDGNIPEVATGFIVRIRALSTADNGEYFFVDQISLQEEGIAIVGEDSSIMSFASDIRMQSNKKITFEEDEINAALEYTEDAVNYANSSAEGRVEITNIICVADVAGSLSGTYFVIYSVNRAYYVWYDVSGGSADPALPSAEGIEVNIATGNSATVVATATAAVLGTLNDFGATSSTATVTVTNADIGEVIDAYDNNTTFTITEKQRGTSGNSIVHGVGVPGAFTAHRVYNAVWNDYAEGFEYDKKELNPMPGFVYKMTENGIIKTNKRAEKATIGVYSDTYGMLIGSKGVIEKVGDQGDKLPIGLAGKVKVKISEKLEIGDSLVSSRDGLATKANLIDKLFRSDRIIGKALQASKDNSIKRIWMIIC